MLSELQYFCIDAMGLSHGIKPAKSNIKLADINPADKQQSVSPQTRSVEQTQTLQHVAKVSPKVKIPEPKKQPEKFIQTGIAPKDITGLDNWENLKSSINSCQYCSELSQNRSQAIFGSGQQNIELMIISEAPSSDEDIQGSPFVGKAGELLDNMLNAININRQDTFITNIIKCQPPNNRDPHKDEAEACSAFLNAQIKLIKPKLILALGRIAAQQLLNVKTPVGQLRNKTHRHESTNTDLIISYHPAYLLRNPGQKAKSWDDLKQVNHYISNYL